MGTILNLANNPAVSRADHYGVEVNAKLTVEAGTGLLANDTDPDGDSLVILGVKLVSGEGTLNWNADGSFSFTPAEGYAGVAVLEYEATDAVVSVSRVGQEFQVNTDPGVFQNMPVAAALSNGQFAVAWKDQTSLSIFDTFGFKAQIIDANGGKIGAEIALTEKSAHNTDSVTVTGLSNGSFLIIWTEASLKLGDPSQGVFGQIYDSAGTRSGAPFLINTMTANSQMSPSVTTLASGGFVVTWQDGSGTLGDDSRWSVAAQAFDAKGVKVGAEFLVNTITAESQVKPSIAALSGGGFVVAWEDYSGMDKGTQAEVAAQVFDASGNRVGTELQVNTETVDGQYVPKIAALSNGGFVVVWQDRSGTLGDQDGDSIKAQIFDAASNRIGAELLVNTETAGSQLAPSVAALVNGNFVVTWTDDSGHGGDSPNSDIKAQVFDAIGGKLGDEFLVNTAIPYPQQQASITALADGGFVIAWEDYSHAHDDQSGNCIAAQIFHVSMSRSTGFATITVSPPPDLKLIGTLGDDLLSGKAGNDVIAGLDGNDLLDGGAGVDTLIGGLGDDTYLVDEAEDAITEAKGQGTDTVRASLSWLLGDNLEILMLTGAGDFSGTGNSLSNRITGNSGNNMLAGKLGADVMTGGTGQDRFVFDTALSKANTDTITDFSVKDDRICLENAIFTKLAKTGTLNKAFFLSSPTGLPGKTGGADDYILYNSKTGALSYDADGSGSKYGAVQFATLSKGLALTYADFVVI